MYRYLIPALFLPHLAWAACPAIPANCPSPTFNILTLGTPLAVTSGGTGLGAALTTNALVLGGSPQTVVGSLGTTTTLLHGNAGGAPTFGAVNLAAEVGATILPVANGGTNLASGTSGGILGYTASGVLASSAALGANGLVIGGGAGATPTAIAAGTNGQIPVGVTSGAPVMQTVGGDATLAANGSLTVSKIGGATAYAGHGLIGVQTFCASGCTATGGTYTPDAGTNQVIIEVQSAGGGGGGCAVTDGTHACVGGSASGGSYAKALFTSTFSGITMTVGAAGAAGASGANAGGNGGTTSAGALISCPGGTGGIAGVSFVAPSGLTPETSQQTVPAACTVSSGKIASVTGQASSVGFAGAITANQQYAGQSGGAALGHGAPALSNAGVATSTGTPGIGYGWGAAGSYSAASQAATTGLAGGPSLIIVYEFN